MKIKGWCETCEEETAQLNGYCLECGADLLWGTPPKSKTLCSWCFVYEREAGQTFCTSCLGDMEASDTSYWYEQVPHINAVIPPIEEELERIPCRGRK